RQLGGKVLHRRASGSAHRAPDARVRRMSGLVIERPAASQDAPLGEGGAGFVKTAVRLVRNLHMIAREFDNPLRSILIGLTANSIDVDVERLRLLKPLDQRFRNQCLALLMGTPGFDV